MSKERPPSKNIVVCCDGTWTNELLNSNPWRLSRMLVNDARKGQVVKYFPGLGFGYDTLKLTFLPIIGTILRFLLAGAIGSTLDGKVKEAYSYISENYQPGDRVWLFGFSRGAYTVRCVAGMIRNCGIVRPSSNSVLPDVVDRAYEIYRSRQVKESPDGIESIKFRKAFSHPESPNTETPIEFLGLWDTVGSTGIPVYNLGKGTDYLELFDDIVPKSVRRVCQALATHEWITNFEPCHIHRSKNHEDLPLLETWFPGVHPDIGMGNATLRWMLEKANAPAGDGIGVLDNSHKLQLKQASTRLPHVGIGTRLLDEGEVNGALNGDFDSIMAGLVIHPFKWTWLSWLLALVYWPVHLLVNWFEIWVGLPYLLWRPRRVQIDIVRQNGNVTITDDLLFNRGDWSMFGKRSFLESYFASSAYEELRRVMQFYNIGLPEGITY